MNKVVIRVEGGIITGIYSTTEEIQFVVVDLDNQEGNETCAGRVLGPDSFFDDGMAYQMFTGSPMEDEAHDELKRIKF